jgi:hypothetical protein
MKNDRIKNDRINSDRIKSGRIKSDRIKTDRIKRITDPFNTIIALRLWLQLRPKDVAPCAPAPQHWL